MLVTLASLTSQVREAFEAALPGLRVVEQPPKGTGHILQVGARPDDGHVDWATVAGHALAQQARDMGLMTFSPLRDLKGPSCSVQGPVRGVKPKASRPGEATVLFTVQGWAE